MNNIKNRFKLSILLKAVFLSIVILLIYSYKRDIETTVVLTVISIVSVFSILIYFKNVNKFILSQKLNALIDNNIKSADFESAKALIHRGRYNIALTKLAAVLQRHPDNKNVITMIDEIKKYLDQ